MHAVLKFAINGNQQATVAYLPSSDYLVIMGALKLQELLGSEPP